MTVLLLKLLHKTYGLQESPDILEFGLESDAFPFQNGDGLTSFIARATFIVNCDFKFLEIL